MNAPRVGKTVWLSDDNTGPAFIVTNVIGTTAYLCPYNELRTTHHGNLYNELGEREWMV